MVLHNPIVDGGVGQHDLRECSTIPIRMMELEAGISFADEHVTVMGEEFELAGKRLQAPFAERCSGCIKHQLKSCQTLLTINNLELLDAKSSKLSLLGYDGTKEVSRDRSGSSELMLGNASN